MPENIIFSDLLSTKKEDIPLRRKIAVIGSGTAGLQLAYALRNDFDVTVIHAHSSGKIKNGRIMSTQVHFGSTINREERFQMPIWKDADPIQSIHISIGEQKLFVGRLKEPAFSVDQRLYFSLCMDDLVKKRVKFRQERIHEKHLDHLVEEFDLVIDCTGKFGPLFSFPKEEELSPFNTPQRKCIVGYFNGIKPNEPLGISVTILPGLGEMFEIPAITNKGPVTILFLMAIPDKELDCFKGTKNSERFTDSMKDITLVFFPAIHERINKDHFKIADSPAFLQTAITPVIRRPYTVHKNKLVVGCGDSVYLNDPITGQGCNLSSYCAEQLYETLLQHKHSHWDLKLGEDYWTRTKPMVEKVTKWSNAMTQEMPPHIIQMLMSGTSSQEAADEIAAWFADPPLAYKDFFQKTIQM
jgi:hypothetical protein